jgi:hypothetical protein
MPISASSFDIFPIPDFKELYHVFDALSGYHYTYEAVSLVV